MTSAKIVTYDLCNPGQNYAALIDRIKQYPKVSKVTESCWLISTTWSCAKVRDDLTRFMDTDDKIFVAALTGEAAWKNIICGNDSAKKSLE